MAGAARSSAAGRFVQAMIGIGLLCMHAALALAHDGEGASTSAQKAAFVLRFAGYVQWPRAADAPSAFHIAVLNDPALAADLENLGSRRTIEGLPVQVTRVTSASQARGARMLVVGAAYRGDLGALLRPLAGNPVLVVTSAADALSAGSVINFLPDQDRLRFEVSLPAARQMGLRIGSEMLSVAARVKQ